MVFFSSVTEMNRLISTRMSNICLKVTNDEKWRTQNFYFLNLKSSSPDQFLGSSNPRRYH